MAGIQPLEQMDKILRLRAEQFPFSLHPADIDLHVTVTDRYAADAMCSEIRRAQSRSEAENIGLAKKRENRRAVIDINHLLVLRQSDAVDLEIKKSDWKNSRPADAQ